MEVKSEETTTLSEVPRNRGDRETIARGRAYK